MNSHPKNFGGYFCPQSFGGIWGAKMMTKYKGSIQKLSFKTLKVSTHFFYLKELVIFIHRFG